MSTGHSQQVNRTPESLADEANSKAVHQDVARSRDAQCKAAKDRYLKAVESRRVYKEDKSGQREYMSDQDADAYREVARKDVQDLCGSVPSFNPDSPVAEPKAVAEPRAIPEPKADSTSG